MRFTIFQDSRQGNRSGNEDRVGYSYSKSVLMMVAADGMGGHALGEVAAEIAVAEITRYFQKEARSRLKNPADFLVAAINAGHRAIVSHAVAQELLESPRTTCVLCVVQGGSAWWAHSGDSRLYVLRDGKLAACTLDHSRVQQLITSGAITAEEAARHPERNKVFSCLGGVVPPIITVSAEFPLQTGDTVVLSTDGFWSQIPAGVLANLLRKKDIVGLMPSLLTEAQRRAKGESDNLSVVAMTWEAQDDSRPAEFEAHDPKFTTSSSAKDHGPTVGKEGVSDDDIEKAIAEIQSAIKKVPR